LLGVRWIRFAISCLNTPPQNWAAISKGNFASQMLCALLGERLCQQISKLILSMDMSNVNSPAVNSRTKWRSIWICFILEWCTGLWLRCVAPRLAYSSEGVVLSLNPGSWRRECIQTVSDTNKNLMRGQAATLVGSFGQVDKTVKFSRIKGRICFLALCKVCLDLKKKKRINCDQNWIHDVHLDY